MSWLGDESGTVQPPFPFTFLIAAGLFVSSVLLVSEKGRLFGVAGLLLTAFLFAALWRAGVWKE